MSSVISKIHVVGMTDETVTFRKADFEQAKQDLEALMEREKNNPRVGERVKLRWQGIHELLYDITSKWGVISY